MRTTHHRAYRTALVAFLTAISFATVSSNFATAQVGGGFLVVSLSQSSVQGHGWSADLPITVTVDDPSTPATVDATRVGTVEPGGDFWFELGSSLQIEAGFVVTATTTDRTTSHEVLPLSPLEANAVSDTVSGVAGEGVELSAWVEGDPAVYRTFTVPAGDGSFVTPSFLDVAPTGTGDGTADLAPGTTGEIAWADLDGNETRRTWHVPQPTITVEPFQNRVLSNQDWPVGSIVDVSLTDIVGCDQQAEVVQWGPSEYEIGFDVWFDEASCDITTGHTITANLPAGEFEAISRSLVVTNIEVTQVDEATERVMGYAELGSRVFLGGNSETHGAWREVTASIEGPDGIGIWVADFTAAGSTSEGDGVLDIAPGVNGTADQPDSDGDLSAAFWGIEEPQVPSFTVQRDSGDVWGGGFAADEELSVFVDGTNVFGPFTADGNGDFHIWLGETFEFVPGQLVEVGSKDLVVSGVEVTTLDPSTGEVAGEAEFGAMVQVWVHEENGEGYETIADGDSGDPEIGLWSVTFLDLSPGTQGAAVVADVDGDQTQTDWRILNPTVRANPADDYVSSNNEWPIGAAVTVDVNGGCEQTVTVVQWDEWSSGFNVDYDGAVCDIAFGDVVTATSGDIVNAVTVLDLSVETVDETTDTVTGFAPFGAEVNVGGGNQDQGGWRLVAANDPVDGTTLGRWTADFTQAGIGAALEGDGWFQIAPGAGGEASIPDSEGDETFVWWGIEEPQLPTFGVNVQGDTVSGGPEWIGPVTILVAGATYEAGVTEDGFFLDLSATYDLVEGTEVTVIDNTGLAKGHVVTGLTVLSADAATDAVDGSANAGNGVYVWIHGEDVYRYVTAQALWQVAFTEAGLADAEEGHGAFDLVVGTAGGAAEIDEDGDWTQIDWEVSNNPPTISDPLDQAVQYSDGIEPIVFIAHDADGATLTFEVSPLPASITASESCAEDGTGGVVCELVLTGTMLEIAGPYLVTVDVVDPDGAVATSVVEIVVVPEDARVQLGGGNPTAVPVDASGASGAFDLSFKIRHADPDVGYAATAGDLTLAIPEIVLHPVGPGSPVSGTCAMTSHDTGYDAHLAVACSFDGVSSNTYFVSASATGGYFDAAANGVLVVYDPSSGQVEGGGTFDWDGDLTEFGFTMEYNKKGKNLKGSFLLIRHTAAGDYLVKSNALHGMATGTDGGTAWATFAGKSTVTTPNGGTVGNHEFVVRVTDEPDSFWIEVLDKQGNAVPSLSMARGEEGQPLNGAALASGDVVVPKGKAKKK